jgi:RNA polymerase primary sigma factor
MQRALENMATPIRVPAYAVDLVHNWRRTANRLRDELGRPPSEDEVAHALKLPKRKLRLVQKALRIYDAERHGDNAIEGEACAGLSVQDTPGGTLEAADEMREVLQLVDRLDERQATILRLRFGLSGENPLTLHEIGARLNLTRERVRQLEREALATLKKMM